jgi:hypothetical protein
MRGNLERQIQEKPYSKYSGLMIFPSIALSGQAKEMRSEFAENG